MVYKKYIKRGNKIYGPYLYHSVKKEGKVTTHYLGKHKSLKEKKKTFGVFDFRRNSIKFFLVAGFLSLLIIALTINLVFLMQLIPTAKVSIDMKDTYVDGDFLTGSFSLILKNGELIPADSQLIINNVGEVSEYPLSDLIDEEGVIEGDFFVENTSVFGFGSGFGVMGEKKVYPTVHVKFRVIDKETGEIVSIIGGEESEPVQPLEPEENITVPGNITEQIPEQNITETPEENITEEPESPTQPIEEPPLEEPIEGEETPKEESSKEPALEEIVEEPSEEPVEEPFEEPALEEPALESEPTSEEADSEPSSEESSGAGITGGVVLGGIIEVEVSNDNPFIYEVEEGQTIEIIESSQEVAFRQEDNTITITTEYFEIKKGFGQEYLSDKVIYFPISISELVLKAYNGEVNFDFVYEEQFIISFALNVSVEQETNETIINETLVNETLINVTAQNFSNMTLEEKVHYIFEREGISVDSQVMAKLIAGERVRVIIKIKSERNFIGKKLEGLGNYEVMELDEENLELLDGLIIEKIVLDQEISLLIADSERIIKSKQSRDDFGLIGKDKKICIIDTGLDSSVVPYSLAWDFINNDSDASDDNGHGTQVSYIAKTIAPDSEILVAKVLDDNGNGYESDVLQGLQWCIEQNPDIISFSIGSGNYDGFCDENFVAELANSAVEQGIFVAAATGNDGSTMLKAPSCASKVVRVAATTKQDEIADFSNVNEALDVFAPGKDIITKTIGNVDQTVSGTSMAVPMITGSVALVLENETLEPEQLRDRFKTTGFPIQYKDINISRINVYNAIINNITLNLTNVTLNQTNITNEPYTTLAVPQVTLLFPAHNNLTSTNTATFNCNASDDGKLVNISLWGNFEGIWGKKQTVSVQPTGNVAEHYSTRKNGDGTFTITYQPNETYGKDTYVYGGVPHGNEQILHIDTHLQLVSRSYLEFDFSPLNEDVIIVNSSLTLYNYNVLQSSWTTLYRVIDSWNENTVTNPYYSSEIYDTKSLASSPVVFNITQLVKEWIYGTYLNYGVRIYGSSDIPSCDFGSSNALNPSQRPKLEITYYVKESTAQFNVTGEGVFNWTCQAEDDGGNKGFANENRTIYMNVPRPILISPSNEDVMNSVPANIIFNCSFEKVKDEISTYLYGNWSSGWGVKNSSSLNDLSNIINMTFTNEVPKGTYNWSCAAQYPDGKLIFASENRTIIVDPCLPPTQGYWNISTNCTFENRVINMPANKGINVLSEGNLTLINSNLLMNPYSSHGSANIKIYPGGEMNITSNSLIKSQVSNNFGFVVDSGANFSMTNSTLEDCGWTDGDGQRGLEVYTKLTNSNFVNNTLKNNYVGISLGDGSDGSIIAGNNIYDNFYAGIYAGENSDNNTIIWNIIHDTQRAILLYKNKGNLIGHNTIYLAGNAVYLDQSHENNINNNDNYNLAVGFRLFSSQKNKFSYNNLTNITGSIPSGGAGIFLNGQSPYVINNIFSNNIIKNCSQYGIVAYHIGTYSYNNSFFNNIITDSPIGVDFSLSTDFNSFDNTFTDCIIQNNTIYDIKVGGGGNNNTFINTTFDFSSIIGGYINVYWYLNVNVTNDSSPLQDANVSGFNKTDNLKFTILTSQNGSIPRQTLLEYFQDSAGRVDSAPYTINTTWEAYKNSTQIPLNKSTKLTIIFDPCDFRGVGEINISTNLTCTNKNIFSDEGSKLNILAGGSLILNNSTLRIGEIKVYEGGNFVAKDCKHTIWLNGNLTIFGFYSLINSTLRVNGTGSNGNIGIRVASTGNLVVNETSDITNGVDSDYRYFFRVEDGAAFEMSSSYLSYAGWVDEEGKRGLEISTSLVNLSNNVLNNVFYGLVLKGNSGSNTFSGNNITADVTGIKILSNNIAIDCQGATINYANSLAGYGVISDHNSTIVKNCNLKMENSEVSSADGIYYNVTSNGEILNNSFDISGSKNCRGIYLVDSSWNLIKNNTIATYGGTGHGVYLDHNTDNNMIEDSSITTYGDGESIRFEGYGYGELDNPNYNNVTNCNISSFDGGHGINYARANSNNIYNTFIQIYGSSGTGINFGDSGNVVLSGNVIRTYNNNEDGIVLDSEDNILIMNQNIKTTGSNSNTISQGAYTHHNIEVIDSVLDATNAYDVEFGSIGGERNFTNVTFNKDDVSIGAGTGKLYVKWYFDAEVKDSAAQPVVGANMTIVDRNNILYFNDSTNVNGEIPTQKITEMFYNFSGPQRVYNNYTVDAYHKDVGYAFEEFNLTGNRKITLVLNPCEPPKNRAWKILKGTCVIEDEIITLNYNLEVKNTGNLTFKNVTLRMNGVGSNGSIGINVGPGGGAFYIKDGSNMTNGDNPNYRYFFIVNSGTNFSMTDSYLSYAGWENNQGQGGLEISTTVKNFSGNIIHKSYYGVSFYSSNNNISNNNITSFRHVIYLNSSSNNTIKDNTLKTSDEVDPTESAYGIYLLSSPNNNITGNKIRTNHHLGHGISIVDSNSNNLADNNITTDLSSLIYSYGFGIYLWNSNLTRISRNNVSTFSCNIDCHGIKFVSSHNNIITDNKISALDTGSFGIDLINSLNNTVIDSVINAGGFYDVSSSGTSNNTFLNSTFNKSKVSVTGGVIYVKWYLDVNVTNSTGDALEDVNVSSWDKYNNFVFSENTTPSGFITRQNLTEYYHDISGKHPYNNYTINATKSPYWPFSGKLNLTNSIRYDIIMRGNEAPIVILIYPEDNESIINRNPNLLWNGVDPDGEDDILGYELDIFCHNGCSEDNREGILINSGTPFIDENYSVIYPLKYLQDNGYYYSWRVRARDSDGWGNWSEEWNFNVTSLVSINLNVDLVSFGALAPGESSSTDPPLPNPFVLENDGNCIANISMNATDLFDNMENQNPSEYFQFKIAEVDQEQGSFDLGLSQMSWANVMASENPEKVLVYFNWSDANDSAEIDIYVEAPYTESSGQKESLIYFTARLAE